MRVVQKRCVHCKITYPYTISGGNPGRFENSTYCPDCSEVVYKALSKVPPKFQKTWAPTTAVTLSQLQDWGQENEKERVDSGGCRRVGFPLYQREEVTGNLIQQVVQIVPGRGEFNGRLFQYSFWPRKEEEAVVFEQVEENLMTNERVPWRDF